MIRHSFFLLFFCCLIQGMENPKIKAALCKAPYVLYEQYQEIMDHHLCQSSALKDKNPLTLLDKLIDSYHKSSWHPLHLININTCRKICAAFTLSRRLNQEIYGSEIPKILEDPSADPDEHLHQFDQLKQEVWNREWPLTSTLIDLGELKIKMKELAIYLETIKKEMTVVVEIQALEPLEKDLQSKLAQIEHVEAVIKNREKLYALTHDPLIHFTDQKEQKEYREKFEKLYPLQTLSANFAERNNGQTLLHATCERKLTHNTFCALLTFLTHHENDLGINQPNNAGQRLLDYAKEIKLNREFITTIETLGGKSSQKKVAHLRWSDVQSTPPPVQKKVS